jgi:hypothetical protein
VRLRTVGRRHARLCGRGARRAASGTTTRPAHAAQDEDDGGKGCCAGMPCRLKSRPRLGVTQRAYERGGWVACRFLTGKFWTLLAVTLQRKNLKRRVVRKVKPKCSIWKRRGQVLLSS